MSEKRLAVFEYRIMVLEKVIFELLNKCGSCLGDDDIKRIQKECSEEVVEKFSRYLSGKSKPGA